MEGKDESGYQILIRTGKLHLLYAADSALTEAELPHILQEESVTGIPEMMPTDPIPGPGIWWTVLVPTGRLSEAQAVIDALPFTFTTEPDIWDSSASPLGRRVISIAIWVFLILIIAILLMTLI